MNRLMRAGVVAALLTAGMIGAALGQTGVGVPDVDSSLVGWWKLDDEGVDIAVDSSMGRHDGILYGNPLSVPGHIGNALWFDGYDDYVDTGFYENLPVWTVSAWVISPDAPGPGRVGGPVHREANFQFNWNHDDPLFQGTAALLIGDTWYPASFGPLSGNQWYHLAATFDGFSLKAYTNGDLIETNAAAQGVPTWEPESLKFGRHAAGPWYFTGAVDDVRVYTRALTRGEIESLALYTPWDARSPHPPRNGNVDIRDVNDLRWSAGQDAVMHDVYFGMDANAVETADVNSPVYRGRQSETTFPLAGKVELGGRYFWRIDEVEADGVTLHQGTVWDFTIYKGIVVDDFESYTDEVGHRIDDTWSDGSSNGTGAQVGDLLPPFAEQTIVHGGRQSLPLSYNNAWGPYYSEAVREFPVAQDWTQSGTKTLCLWLRGDVVGNGEAVSIGIEQPGNSPDDLYVALEDGAGKRSVVTHPNPDAVNALTWAEWRVPLTSFTDVNLCQIKRMGIGIGSCLTPTPDGTGRLYIDDITLSNRPALSTFGIYLVETGDLLLAEQDIAAYVRATHTIQLNTAGIQKWNSYVASHTSSNPTPRGLRGGLYQKEFAVRLDGKERYRGKFWSAVSSVSYFGVVILDVALTCDDIRNSIHIEYGYPAPMTNGTGDPRNNQEIFDFFAVRGKLR